MKPRAPCGPACAVLVNSPAETAFARAVATELVGEHKVTLQGPPLTGCEDFAFMLERVPGSTLLIGNGAGESGEDSERGACMAHNPGHDFNDHNVAIGSAYWVLLAEHFLSTP
jgi:hippurate hydrolase